MTEQIKSLYCCGCSNNSQAQLVSGKEIYPHRPDLYSLPFWQCLKCKNYVGCHHKTRNKTKPLGCIATPEIKKARQHIHKLIDPLWQPDNYNKRDFIYSIIAKELGRRKYHTANIRSIEEAREVWKIAKRLPQLLIEIKEKEIAADIAFRDAQPIKGKRYLVSHGLGWVEGVFYHKGSHSCQLHGDLYYDYNFKLDDGFTINVSIYGEASRESQIKELQENIKNA